MVSDFTLIVLLSISTLTTASAMAIPPESINGFGPVAFLSNDL